MCIQPKSVSLIEEEMNLKKDFMACKITLDLLLDVEEIKSIGKANLKGE